MKTVFAFVLVGIFVWLFSEWWRSKNLLRQLKQQKFGAFEITSLSSFANSHLAIDAKGKKVAFIDVDTPSFDWRGNYAAPTHVRFMMLDIEDVKKIGLSLSHGLASVTFHYQRPLPRSIPGIVVVMGGVDDLQEIVHAHFREDIIEGFGAAKSKRKIGSDTNVGS